jgi:release factor glutamine methyltransferase
VAYLVGEQEFWSLPFAVDPRVLVPRRDTETLVEAGVRVARGQAVTRAADIGTGSGAIACALAVEIPSAKIVAVDSSEDALAVARANVERHKLGERVILARGDLVAPLDGAFELIVSNPPYVKHAEIATLSREVQREPHAALDGGADGLDVLRRLIPAAAPRLAPGGVLAVEHGYDQGAAVRALFADAGYQEIATAQDLAANDRVTQGRRGG